MVRSLGQLDTVHTLLKGLADARPRSGPVREAYVEAVLVKSKELIDRCSWTEAELLLRPLARDKSAGRNAQAALLNLLGCCCRHDPGLRRRPESLQRRPEAVRQRCPACTRTWL